MNFQNIKNKVLRKVIMAKLVGALVMVPFCGEAKTILSYESITIADTAIGISASSYASLAENGECAGRLESGQIRFRADGTSPTSNEGVLLDPGDIILIHGLANIKNFKAIRTGSTSGVLKVHCAN